MNPSFAPLRRFWWLAFLAVPVAIVAGLLVLYQVELGSGVPRLNERNKPTYQATVQVLVTSRANPYLRAEDGPTSQAMSQSLLDAANYLPFIVESDRVAAIRTKQVGKLNGAVEARALFAQITTNRGLRPSSIPIIEVSGFARTERGASRLARGSVDALITWLAAEQNRTKVRRSARVLLEPLRSPTVTVHQQKSTGLAVLVFVVVLVGFLVFAWMLDRVFPRSGFQEGERSAEASGGPMLEPIHSEPVAHRAPGSRHQPGSAASTAARSVDVGPGFDRAPGPPFAGTTENPEAPAARTRRHA